MKREPKFCKSRKCPSTEAVILFATDELETDEVETVFEHLAKCDFCAAEVQLLANFPPCGETPPAPELPFQLRRLAEMMLAGKNYEHLFLRRLFEKKKSSLSHKTGLLR